MLVKGNSEKELYSEDDLTANLKPCPFCGSEATYHKSYDDYNNDCIVCSNHDCGVTITCSSDNKTKYISSWNNRVSNYIPP